MDIQNIKNCISLPSLEGMTKAKSLLLITGTILYVDCALNIFYKKNIQNFSWSSFFNSENIFPIIIFIFSYSALFTFLLPGLNFAITVIIKNIEAKYKKVKLLDFDCRRHVTLYNLKRYAEVENNFVLYEEYEKIENSKSYSETLSKISFCVVFLMILDFILGDSSNKTILHYFLSSDSFIENLIYSSVKESVLSGVIVFVVLGIFHSFIVLLILYFPVMWWNSTFSEDVEWISNPELAKIVNKDIIENQKKHKELFEELL